MNCIISIRKEELRNWERDDPLNYLQFWQIHDLLLWQPDVPDITDICRNNPLETFKDTEDIQKITNDCHLSRNNYETSFHIPSYAFNYIWPPPGPLHGNVYIPTPCVTLPSYIFISENVSKWYENWNDQKWPTAESLSLSEMSVPTMTTNNNVQNNYSVLQLKTVTIRLLCQLFHYILPE